MRDERLSEQQLREFYRDGYVSKYPTVDNGRLAQQLKQVSLGRDDRVVDFACGNGLLLDLIHSRVKDYVGVDFSSEFIEDAETRMRAQGISNGSFQCMDIVGFCESHREEFDIAFASDFAEHIYDDDFVTLYTAMRGTLRPGGKLYTHTPNGDFFLERLKTIGILKQLEEHIAIRNEGEMVHLLNQCGYEVIECYRLRHYRWFLAWVHPLASVPGLREIFSARLLFECENPIS